MTLPKLTEEQKKAVNKLIKRGWLLHDIDSVTEGQFIVALVEEKTERVTIVFANGKTQRLG